MDSSGIPTDGPETVLGQVARRLRLRYSRTFVARAVARHPRSNSLLALVEVGKELGMKATAGQTDASALGELPVPMIVHFNGVQGGGFGVLEGVTADGCKVWDNTNGSHMIDRGVFLEHWSGIVATVERAESAGVREKGYLRNRVTEVVFSGYEPPAVVGHKGAAILRATLGALLAILLILAIAAQPVGDRPAAAVITLLSVVGLMVTIVTGVSIGAQDSTLSDRICARGRFVDCHSVLSSRYSRLFGVSLSDIGIAVFGAILLLIATGAVAIQDTGVWPVVALVYAASVPLSVILVGVQISMRQLCTLCLAVHAVNVMGAAVAWFWFRPGGRSFGDLVAPGLLLALYLFLILFLVIPYFRKHQGLRVLAGMHRRISGSPFASLAEILTEKPTGLLADLHGVPLGGPGTEHELVVFVHPSCGKCDSVFGEVRALVAGGLVRAYVGLAPKDPEEADRHACSAVVAVGLVLGPERLIEAYAAAKKQLRTLMTEDPVPILAAELSVSEAPVAEAIDAARRIVDRAEGFVDEHAEGTPAVFFNSRLYRGELGHLAFLLQHHPNLLAETSLQREPDTHDKVEGVPSS